jgi:hypothetical protein
MVDALVELVVDPGAGAAFRQQRLGCADQVVIVEQGLPGFQPFELAEIAPRQPESGQRGREHPEPRQPVENGDHLGLGLADAFREIGKPVMNRLGGNAAKLGGRA